MVKKMNKGQYVMIMAGLTAAMLVMGYGMLMYGDAIASSLSGYQSITASWYKVEWPNAQGSGIDLTWPKSGNIIQWDGDDTQDKFTDGMTDLNTYSAEVENPKWLDNINYKEWWINDTVDAENPQGWAKHYEWAIDLYTVNVNFRVTDGVGGCKNVEFWVQFMNNVDSVFKVLGAEDAASYIIYAQTEEYTWTPESALHHIILPTVSNFEMFFMNAGKTIAPSIPEEGSDLDFVKLAPYSHVAIKFIFDDFGAGWGESHPTVNMLLELNVLTLGRFDYVLSYVEGGEDEAAPYGLLGIIDGIGAALDAGWGALVDGFTEMGPDILLPVMVIVIGVVILVLVIYFGGIIRKAASR